MTPSPALSSGRSIVAWRCGGPLRAGRVNFVSHQKRLVADKKVYLGRLCRFDAERRSVSAGRYWLSHSMDSIRGSRVKHNTNLYSCTYFSGLQVEDDLVRIGYGINDVDYGASVHHPDTL